MKKLNYFLTVVAGTMMFASCSSDKDVLATVDEDGVQKFVLQVASTGDGLTTRAGRELLSEEAAQKIDVVDVYFVGDNGTVKCKSVKWDNAKPYTTGGAGLYETISFSGDQRLPQGEYKVYAIGYSYKSNYIIPKVITTSDTGVSAGQETTVNDTKYEYVNAADIEDYVMDYSATTKKPEEIFAGSLDEIEINDKKQVTSTNNSIVLHRQVAGTYFYVYNLPYFDGMNENTVLQLVASDCNDQLVLGNFAESEIVNNGTGNTNVNYVVNGTYSTDGTSPSAKDLVLCQAKISDWYYHIVDTDNDGLVDLNVYENASKGVCGEDAEGANKICNWIASGTAKAIAAKRKGSGYKKGSIFESSFIIPFKSISEEQTLKLQLVTPSAEEGGEATLHHSWNVNLQKDSDAPSSLSYWTKDTENKWNKLTTPGESRNCYSIVRNHLYCVGKKLKAGPTYNDPEDPKEDPDPDDPNPDPNPDPDPENLANTQEIVVRVNHNWEVIYRMELD